LTGHYHQARETETAKQQNALLTNETTKKYWSSKLN
jgi:hypothetical protein